MMSSHLKNLLEILDLVKPIFTDRQSPKFSIFLLKPFFPLLQVWPYSDVSRNDWINEKRRVRVQSFIKRLETRLIYCRFCWTWLFMSLVLSRLTTKWQVNEAFGYPKKLFPLSLPCTPLLALLKLAQQKTLLLLFCLSCHCLFDEKIE